MSKFTQAFEKAAAKVKEVAINIYLEGGPVRNFYDTEHIHSLNVKLTNTPYRIERNRGEGEGMTIGYWVTKERPDAVQNPIGRFILNTTDDVFSTKDHDVLERWLKRNLSKELGWSDAEKTISPEALSKALAKHSSGHLTTTKILKGDR